MWYSKEYDPIQVGSIDGTDTEPHDDAVRRATLSHYRPPNQLKTDPHCTVFIGRLSFDTTETSLRSHFERYGDISHIELIRNHVTGLSQGYGFITFTSQRSAKDAYHEANKSVLDSNTILVDFERSRVMKNWIPRRLGGGFGGKKESGQLRFGARDRPFREPPSTSRLDISHEQKRSDCWTRSFSERSRSRSTDRQRHHRPKRQDGQPAHQSKEKRLHHHHRSRHRSSSTDRHRRRSRSPSSIDRHRSSGSNRTSYHHRRDSSRPSYTQKSKRRR